MYLGAGGQLAAGGMGFADRLAVAVGGRAAVGRRGSTRPVAVGGWAAVVAPFIVFTTASARLMEQ